MLPLTLRLTLYTHRLPTTIIEGWNDTKVQVLLARKAWISSLIALCHALYLLTSLKTIGSWVGGDTTRLMEAAVAVVVVVDSAVFGCLGQKTMWCWGTAGHEGEELVPVSCWRGYEERSTKSCRPARESVEGLVGTTNTGEPAAELVCYVVELVYSAELVRTSIDGEPIPA